MIVVVNQPKLANVAPLVSVEPTAPVAPRTVIRDVVPLESANVVHPVTVLRDVIVAPRTVRRAVARNATVETNAIVLRAVVAARRTSVNPIVKVGASAETPANVELLANVALRRAPKLLLE